MGSGKSTVGVLLSQLFQFEFRDLDALIEEDQGSIVSEIFEEKGEAFFRKLEHQKLRQLCAGENQVIALGGGTLLNKNNIALVKKSGILIYLATGMDEVVKRIRKSETRPLFKKARQVLETLFKAREQGYEEADLKIENNENIESVLNAIINKLEDGYGISL